MLQKTGVSANLTSNLVYGGTFQTDDGRTSRAALAERFEAEAVPHFQVLQSLALYLVRDKAAADDLVQETFAQALKSFDRYETGTNCRAWLCKIMFYKRVQWIRANSRFCQFDEDESQFPVVTYSSMLSRNFMSEKVSRAFFDLPDKFRRIVWLCEVEEFTYREIAASLDIPVGTVMSRLHRGRKMLRDNFKFYADKSSNQTTVH